MVKFFALLLAAGSMLLPSQVIAAPTPDQNQSARQAGALPPRQDPFYTAPAGFEGAAPGTILRTREVPGALNIIANCSGAYQLNYRTTDSNGNPAFAVTTIFIPLIKSGGSISNLVSYQTAYDSANVDDSPSYTFFQPGLIDPSIPAALALGWFVNSPDYEGPLAAFTAGIISGQATLDSVRAALSYGDTLGLKEETRYTLWGYSGGALASEWAAELQAGYAPELNISGVAIGGLTPNVTSVLLTVNDTPFSSLNVNGILGQMTQNEAANQYVLDNLKQSGPYNATRFLGARTTPGAANKYNNENIFDYFVPGTGILRGTPLRAAVDVNGVMGFHGVPQMPIFLYKAVKDQISNVTDTDEVVNRYCSQGARILYQRNSFGDHGLEAIGGLPRAILFLAAIFGGTYNAGTGCDIQNVTLP